MARKPIEGDCHICGLFGKLSFEHVPPQKAFNDRPVVKMEIEKYLEVGPLGPVRGRTEQRGMGDYTLCERCNNRTGHWYGAHFVDWCYQGMYFLSRTGGRPSLVYLHYMFPLSILKQIVVMFFSVNSTRFRLANPELEWFVMNPERRYLNPKYRFFAYYNLSRGLRSTGISGVLMEGRVSTMSEIAFPPFGYAMTINSPPPDPRLFDITHFARYRYKEHAVVYLKLPVLPTVTPFPGDYRTEEEVVKQTAANIALGGLSSTPV
jgi:hypothetical protein